MGMISQVSGGNAVDIDACVSYAGGVASVPFAA